MGWQRSLKTFSNMINDVNNAITSKQRLWFSSIYEVVIAKHKTIRTLMHVCRTVVSDCISGMCTNKLTTECLLYLLFSLPPMLSPRFACVCVTHWHFVVLCGIWSLIFLQYLHHSVILISIGSWSSQWEEPFWQLHVVVYLNICNGGC